MNAFLCSVQDTLPDEPVAQSFAIEGRQCPLIPKECSFALSLRSQHLCCIQDWGLLTQRLFSAHLQSLYWIPSLWNFGIRRLHLTKSPYSDSPFSKLLYRPLGRVFQCHSLPWSISSSLSFAAFKSCSPYSRWLWRWPCYPNLFYLNSLLVGQSALPLTVHKGRATFHHPPSPPHLQ